MVTMASKITIRVQNFKWEVEKIYEVCLSNVLISLVIAKSQQSPAKTCRALLKKTEKRSDYSSLAASVSVVSGASASGASVATSSDTSATGVSSTTGAGLAGALPETRLKNSSFS